VSYRQSSRANLSSISGLIVEETDEDDDDSYLDNIVYPGSIFGLEKIFIDNNTSMFDSIIVSDIMKELIM
jgi:hypothetical protein